MRRLEYGNVRALLLLLITTSLIFGFNKVGTTAAPFLKIEYGARPVGMGGTFVALANDPAGIYYNPAGIAEIENTQFMGGYTVWFADLKYNYATFILPTSFASSSLRDLIRLSLFSYDSNSLS